VSAEPPDTRSHLALAWIGLGATVIGVAFALRPQEPVSGTAFWSVLVLGIAAICVGGASIAIGRIRRTSGRRNGKRRRRLVAIACDRYAETLSAFIEEQWRSRPRPFPFGNGAARMQRWQDAVEASFRKNFRAWGLETFDEAARLGGVAESLRSSVEAPSIEQLRQLPDLFRDAARSLERG
jgi:hypothetical protein